MKSQTRFQEHSKTSLFNVFYQKMVIRVLRNMKYGHLQLILPNHKELSFGDSQSDLKAYISIKNPEVFRQLVYYADIGLGESYQLGWWDTPSIKDVIHFFILNRDNGLKISGAKNKPLVSIGINKILKRLRHLMRANSMSGSRKNIEEHYDLSNELYKNFLDESMTYSSALFSENQQDLQTAQEAKYQRICQIAKINKADHVCEIGTGWGSFSLYAAKNYGCKITSYTISKEQFEYAQQRVQQEKLSDLITIKLMDYRKIQGQFDKIVSIEMMEAIGDQYMPVFFRKCDQILKPKGLMAFQVICSPSSRYQEFKKNVDWIQTHIFPGTLLPSVQYLLENASRYGDFDLYSLKDMGGSYAKTLNIWREQFNNNFSVISQQGFDEKFQRKWNYYLSYCEAAFASKNITVYQMLFSRPNNIDLFLN